MATAISVNKQSIKELLTTGRTKPFLIPEYQRPYAWTDEQIETLFEDIWEFSVNVGGSERNNSYFLGSIVSFENENGEQEIIDGQQRITSLFLLLRAIYTKLSTGDDSETEKAQNFIRQIEPTIWQTDKLTGKVDFSKILLTSAVVDNDGNEVLKNILKTGDADSKATDNYSKNYLLFQKLYDKHCQEAPFAIYDFIYALLNQAILLPISADTQDTALTIFSTLNNRGLPLSDADIFKAKIYNNLTDDEKKEFIAKWKKLEKEATEAQESIQQLFYYYMFVLRAKEGDVKSTTPGIRKYYSENKFSRLYDKDLLEKLRKILNIWKVVNTNQDIPGELWDNNPEIRKALDILSSYPNEYWKYPVVIYYLSYWNEPNFDNNFLLFLRKLIQELMLLFALTPTINVVKGDILKLNKNITASPHPKFEFKPIQTDLVKGSIISPNRNIVRMLLKVYAYNHQTALLPDNWQIEHILPQKWQKTFFSNYSDEEVNELVEHIGNKTPFERRLNIVASNGYFDSKRSEYKKSKITVTNELQNAKCMDWSIDNIQLRDNIVSDEILNAVTEWSKDYEGVTSSNQAIPTEEEKKIIEDLKRRGLI